MSKRVAITGIGVFSPIGNNVSQVLDSLHHGKSGIVSIEKLQLQHPADFLCGKINDFLEKARHTSSTRHQFQDASVQNLFEYLHGFLKEQYFEKVRGLKVGCIGMVKNFSAADFIQPKEIKKTDRFQQLALAASEMAKRDAGLEPWVYEHYPTKKIGVIAGSSMGGMLSWEETYLQYLAQGLKGVKPYFMIKQPVDTAAGEISRHQGANGPVECPVAACATGALVVGRAYQLVKQGMVDVAFATASEASLSHLGLGGFEALKALATKDYGDPTKASRPFDRDRSGFVMAEGGASLILENLAKARKRGARIYAEIIGFGNFADAFHPTRPNPEGKYAAIAMQYALKDGRLNPADVGYINAHGTSTLLNDSMETKAIKKAFDADLANRIPVSSTKSISGHLMGASGTLEAGICALALYHQFLPPTINYDHPDPECDLADYVPNQAREAKLQVALSNSFGFGGRDVALVLSRFD
ncbi:MAG: beta-ketoacyl-ACP synthase II [Deltaproteobacteria bacterium]|nr:beta-ketoacyl-ACP synthase II [Deltaproteobacteria bacterium]